MVSTEKLDTGSTADMLHVAAERLSRTQMQDLIAAAYKPIRFEDCDFEGEDLSRLDLSRCEFQRCSIADTSFFAALLIQTRWQSCRGSLCLKAS